MDKSEHRIIDIRARTVWTVLGNTLLLVGLLALLWRTSLVVGWALIAALLALALNPAVVKLERRGVSRGIAVLLLLLTAASVIGVIVGTFVPMVVEQGQELIKRAPDLLDRLSQTPPVQWADRNFGIVQGLEGELHRRAATVATPALAVAASIVSGVFGAISIIALTVFMLLFGGGLFDKSLAWVDPAKRPHVELLASRMRTVVGGYVAGSLLVASIGGVVMSVTTLFLGVPYFLPLGLIMILLGLIPLLGSAIGAVLVIGITFATAGLRDALIVTVIYLVYQQLEGHLLLPMVQKRTIQMNPLLITLVVLLGTTLAGVLGTILALPVAGALQVWLQDALAQREAGWAAAAEEEARVHGPPAVGDGERVPHH